MRQSMKHRKFRVEPRAVLHPARCEALVSPRTRVNDCVDGSGLRAELERGKKMEIEMIKQAYERWQKADSEWIEAILDLATKLAAARGEHKGDQDFGLWLE